jgi:hypothetical protein
MTGTSAGMDVSDIGGSKDSRRKFGPGNNTGGYDPGTGQTTGVGLNPKVFLQKTIFRQLQCWGRSQEYIVEKF